MKMTGNIEGTQEEPLAGDNRPGDTAQAWSLGRMGVLADPWPEALPLDEIHIEGLEVYAHHGVYPQEKEKGQTFVVNAVLHTDIRRAGSTDELAHSADYGAVCHFITDWMQGRVCNLLETVAEGLARAILLSFGQVREIDLEIRKPEAPIGLPFGCVSVRIHRKWARTYLAFGSNMGDKKRYIEEGIGALKAHPMIRVGKISDTIVTKPYGGVEQEDFLNGVLEADTLLSPEELLETVHAIENAAGRVRQVHWGPRTLDLDILFYDHLVYESDHLAIPHPDMQNRDFVLIPLNGVAPHLVHPLLRKRVSQLLAELVNGRMSC